MADYTYTLTLGDAAENHRGMQMLGSKYSRGVKISELESLKIYILNQNIGSNDIHIIYLPYEDAEEIEERAAILIWPNGMQKIGINPDELEAEHTRLEKDKKALMYGRVVNKHARHNLCFDDVSQEPDYSAGKGRVYNFADVPLTSEFKNKMQEYLSVINIDVNLKCEGNYYYDIKKCGIGFHGDTERAIVIGARLGADFPLIYQAYRHNEVIPDTRTELTLKHGDIYIMSQNAVGQDWKSRNKKTWRHAAGYGKFVR